MIKPVTDGILTHGFDELRNGKTHGGYDITSPTMPAFTKAICDSVVIEAGWSDSFGYRAWLEPTDKEIKTKYPFFIYAHHAKPLMVKTGQTIKAGTLIGEMGNTGLSHGRHLHLGARTKPDLTGQDLRIPEIEALY